MDYEAISRIAHAACVDAIKSTLISNTRPATIEQQAAVFTAGISAALQEYDRQKNEQ